LALEERDVLIEPKPPQKRIGSVSTSQGTICLEAHREPSLRLSTIVLTNPKALFVELFSTTFPRATKALVDSGLSNFFIDPKFVVCHKLSAYLTNPLLLSLIDSTVSNFVKEIVTIPIRLICSLSFELDLFVTPLAGEHPIVLGHSWLKVTNPMID